jgi:mRNA interferase HigB
MRVVGQQILGKFSKSHADVRQQIASWLYEIEEAHWQSPDDVKARYMNASLLAGNRVIFNLKGNKYRLATQISYKTQIVLILKIGTHAEYSKWTF